MVVISGLETLSKRAAANVDGIDDWSALANALANPWTPENTDGMVVLGIAENELMHDELEEHITQNFAVDRRSHFTYGSGPQGSPALCTALSKYFNDRFHPLQPTEAHEFFVTSGATAMIDELTWCICDVDEGILFPQPLYAGFANDVPTRARGKLVPVPFAREDGSLHLDDVFDIDSNLRCLEQAYQKSGVNGIKIRGVMITNPHNPLGKCYPIETIKAIAGFCAKYNLHYISDEIYAMSVFQNPGNPKATPFTSVLSIALDSIIRPELVHVLYGAAKDFCANGLRLGAFHSRSPALRSAFLSIITFAWPPYIGQDLWARLLNDEPFLERFLSTNQQRLANNYAIITSFLDEQSIPYFRGGNAGVFLWVDLRKWLVNGSKTEGLRITSPEIETFKAKQNLLNETCQRRGLWMATGESFFTEEIGWFRIVFTAREDVLRVGLERLVQALAEFENIS